ncbi:MAG: hypothetical protein ACYC4R_15990 [Anaerolineae bacterium]
MGGNELAGDTHELTRILESAQRLGVEMDEADALQWLGAMAASNAGGDVVMDTSSGVFGHKVSLLDFSAADLTHYREVGRIVEFFDEPGVVETALALSGSAAQSKIQTYPGDCDFFERVNIRAATREEACRILARIMREKALSALKGPTYQLIEVKFGSYPVALARGERTIAAGSPIAWLPAEIEAGGIEAKTPEGEPYTLAWEAVCGEPGWCKLDWVVADPARGQLANASNMLDVTWEAPDGTITPLDGYLDPYFQEVYLDAQSVPIFAKLAKHVSADALDDYIAALEREVKKYLTKDVNYGKVAKRMYNIFRLTGRYQEAAFLRELFDEPATLLYQVWSLIRTLDDCSKPGGTLPVENLLAQADHLILEVVNTLEGDKEVEIVRYLLRLRDSIAHGEHCDGLNPQAEAARSEVINLVNNFFYDRLIALPTIKDYMDGFASGAH